MLTCSKVGGRQTHRGRSNPFAGDLTKQLEIFLENLVGQHVDAIGIAPVDSSGIAPAVKDATSAGIPIVAIDTAVNGADALPHLSQPTNVAVAKVQGAIAATLVSDGAAIIYVTGDKAQSTGQDRHNVASADQPLKAARPKSEILGSAYSMGFQPEAQGRHRGDHQSKRKDIKMIVSAWDGKVRWIPRNPRLQNLGYKARRGKAGRV